MQIRSKEAEKKRVLLTLEELERLSEANTYKSVGKLLKSRMYTRNFVEHVHNLKMKCCYVCIFVHRYMCMLIYV